MRIGVFDSGIGGLTVLRALRRAWPGHSTVYLGDTARVPYGSKSGATVVRYAKQNAKFLMGEGIELLVVACNTASAYGIEALREELSIPVVGVIEPGAAAAVEGMGAKHIGVIGTSATVASGAYERAISRLRPGVRITARACPLLVPLVEEGWEATTVAEAVVRQYVGDWAWRRDARGAELPGMPSAPDTPEVLVLGCTHYPVLRPVLGAVLGAGVRLVDSAEATAEAVGAYLKDAPREPKPVARMIVTDGAPGFARVAARLLGVDDVALEVADLWKE